MDELTKIMNKIKDIATIYARYVDYYDYHGTNITINDDSFFFTLHPSCPGIGKYISLPLSLLEEELDENKIAGLAHENKVKEDEEKARNTCKECGMYRTTPFDLNWYYPC